MFDEEEKQDMKKIYNTPSSDKKRIMKRFSLLLWLLLCGQLSLSSVEPAWGQLRREDANSSTAYSFSYSPIFQFESDLDGGGRFDVNRHYFAGGVKKQVNRKLRLGFAVSHHAEAWNFNDRIDVAGATPWETIQRFGFSLPIRYVFNKKWIASFSAMSEFAGEAGAESDDSLVYGGVLFLTHPFGKGSFFGFGFRAFQGLEEASLMPFILVNWRITPNLRLSNPFRSGPAGPAGLELIYTPATNWEMSIGGAYRTMRFRLDDDNAVSNGIGENESLVAFLRLQRKLGRVLTVDLMGGVLANGKISIDNSNGDSIGEEDYDPASFLAITLKAKF